MHPFERALSVTTEEIEFNLLGFEDMPWLDYWLNPRKLRGSDFLMRWSQGEWSESRLIEAINSSNKFFAIPYGPSSAAPDDDVRAFELYFERLEAAGLGNIKRPDLLLFKKENEKQVLAEIEKLGGISELPFTKENQMGEILDHAILAIECENSLWITSKMPGFGTPLTPQRRLKKQLGLKKNGVVVPTVIIKDEDRDKLLQWQTDNGISIHVWHAFFDRAYGLSLNRAEELIRDNFTEPTLQKFQSSNGSTQVKIIYKHYYHHAYDLGIAIEEPELLSAFIVDKNGHILPYVKFKGGKLKIEDKVFEMLSKLPKRK